MPNREIKFGVCDLELKKKKIRVFKGTFHTTNKGGRIEELRFAICTSSERNYSRRSLLKDFLEYFILFLACDLVLVSFYLFLLLIWVGFYHSFFFFFFVYRWIHSDTQLFLRIVQNIRIPSPSRSFVRGTENFLLYGPNGNNFLFLDCYICWVLFLLMNTYFGFLLPMFNISRCYFDCRVLTVLICCSEVFIKGWPQNSGPRSR